MSCRHWEVLALRMAARAFASKTDGGKNAGIGVYLKTMIPGGDEMNQQKLL